MTDPSSNDDAVATKSTSKSTEASNSDRSAGASRGVLPKPLVVIAAVASVVRVISLVWTSFYVVTSGEVDFVSSSIRTAFLVSLWVSVAISAGHLLALWSGRSGRIVSTALALIFSVVVFAFVRILAGEPALALFEVAVLFASLFIVRFAIGTSD